VQEVYTAGEARERVQTAAFNLPNDELCAKKGIEEGPAEERDGAKFRQSGSPSRCACSTRRFRTCFVRRLLQPTLFHALSHARTGLRDGRARRGSAQAAEELYSTSRCKADVLGVWNILFAQNRKLLNPSMTAAPGHLRRADVPRHALGIGERTPGTRCSGNWLREKKERR